MTRKVITYHELLMENVRLRSHNIKLVKENIRVNDRNARQGKYIAELQSELEEAADSDWGSMA